MIGTTVSHYHITEKLGEGGMGVVYKAHDTTLNRPVALKFLSPHLTADESTRKRFVVEAQAASALDHPNICNIHEISETSDGQLYICMAHYQGESLRQRIKRGPLPFDEAAALFHQVASGVKAAHEKKIIHRDLKPGNILITEKGEAKIVDFGLAKLAGTDLTRSTSSKGTIAYMPPEQIRGDKVDHRGDIWALGVVLYEMLTGHLPFGGDYPEPLMFSIVNEEPKPLSEYLSDVPESLQGIVDGMLKKDPGERYESVRDVIDDFEQLANKEEVTFLATRSTLGRMIRKKSTYVTAGVIAVLAILAMTVGRPYIFPGGEGRNRLAVILMSRETDPEEGRQFSEGVADRVVTQLARIEGLSVASRSTSVQFESSGKTPPEISQESDIHYMVELSAHQSHGTVTFSARLLDATKDEYIWAEEYRRPISGILGLLQSVARDVANEIDVPITPPERTRLEEVREVNPEMYVKYVQGMWHVSKITTEEIKKGIEYLEEAIAKDPDEPLVHAGLALAYQVWIHMPNPPPEAEQIARPAALRALELDESVAEAHLALAMNSIYNHWDIETAGQHYRRALELDPSLALAHAHYGWYQLYFGNREEALAELQRAKELDPLVAMYPAFRGEIFFWLGRPDEALEEAQQTLELDPEFEHGHYVRGLALINKGLPAEAIEPLRKCALGGPIWDFSLGIALARAGRIEDARSLATELESREFVNTWGVAAVYVAIGDYDRAMYWLEKGRGVRHPYIPWLKVNDAMFGDLHKKDERYVRFVEGLNFPGTWLTLPGSSAED